MSLPPSAGYPAPAAEPVVPSRVARRCSACSGPLEPQGPRPFRLAASATTPEGVVVLEMFWCPHCGKVELYSVR